MSTDKVYMIETETMQQIKLLIALPPTEKDWTEDDKSREQELMDELVTIIEQRNQIVNCMDQDRQR